MFDPFPNVNMYNVLILFNFLNQVMYDFITIWFPQRYSRIDFMVNTQP